MTKWVCDNCDLLVFSHLRWDFVFQRPQHLMTRFSSHRRVFFIEEPIIVNTAKPSMSIRETKPNLFIVTPQMSADMTDHAEQILAVMIRQMLQDQEIEEYVSWYYTPMALNFTRSLKPKAIIYDCMDELSKFKFANEALVLREAELFRTADLVFTGGRKLYEAKKKSHLNIHPFPSSIDREHFRTARKVSNDPADQKAIAHPRIGYFGVIDERIDLDLIQHIATQRPDWQIVMIGPVVKIAPESLPQAANIHYLGMKDYKDLPSYIAGWDVAMLPFALNEATLFISPTKTPEYLAAGRQVVSTNITDVVSPYGTRKLVQIAESHDEFVSAIEKGLEQKGDSKWLAQVDAFLADTSWDQTWQKMALLELQLQRRSSSTKLGVETIGAQ